MNEGGTWRSFKFAFACGSVDDVDALREIARLEACDVAAVDGKPPPLGEKGENGEVAVEPDVLGLMMETEIEFAADTGGAIALAFVDADAVFDDAVA